MSCTCFIIPNDVLEKLSKDAALSEEIRNTAARNLKISKNLRKLRVSTLAFTKAMNQGSSSLTAELSLTPAATVYDCKHLQTLPGIPVPNPASSPDLTASRTYKLTTAVADFYKKVFGRNSINGAGMTMMSSVHFGVDYNNAMWNGAQMIYGDGDNKIFTDFTLGNDVVGHELTHGVTQYTLQLKYSDDAGGLNESLSDCFGSMFRQWQAKQDVTQADWLIGHDIMGPVAVSRGYTCLRNMANPADVHALAPQPVHYSQLTPGMDPHYTSGPPNLAFCLACKSVGGKSWEIVGQIWYRAMQGRPSPNMKMKDFANRTRKLAIQMYRANPSVATSVDDAWKQVGL
jgi:Zn-dependent metalloprotease